MSKIVGICGSPRESATAFVLKKTLSMLEEKGYQTDYFSVRGKKINFCIHCDTCIRTGKCVFKDDMIELYTMLEDADGMVLATPVYQGGCSAQLKAVIDRFRAVVAPNMNFFYGKVGMGIAVGGDRTGGQELALQQIITFYLINGVTPISGGSFGANIGASFWSKDTLEDVMEDEEGFKSLKKTVKMFIKKLEESRGV
ncbi:MAG: flavodoxin family protein [Methermicoccaceae archaeon]